MNLLSRLPRDWPVPEAEALNHAQQVTASLIERIMSQGSLPFDQVMEHLLYAPGLGYYSAGARKFGEGGDFVTAPEVSPLFSATLAHQVAEAMDYTAAVVLEVGAGSGTMAADLLLELEQLGRLPHHYWIVERSADLRERQQQTLDSRCGHLASRVDWLDQWPETFSGVLVANELLDAFAVSRFRYLDGQVLESCIAFEADDFVEHFEPATPSIVSRVEALLSEYGPWPDGFTSEVCSQLPHWLAGLTQSSEKVIALFIDYGYAGRDYYHPQRRNGTLMCHYRHRAHEDVFLLPGLQDITAHVDFTFVAQQADFLGFHLLGYGPQAQFLLSAGLGDIMMARSHNVEQQLKYAQQVKTLTLPGEMGERFKVMALGNVTLHKPLMGFSMLDHSSRL